MIAKNTTVWITGASSGIGESLAYEFAAKGCKLILSARNQQALQRVKENCPPQTQIEIVPIDLAKYNDIQDIVNQTLKKVGKVDILINNAGVSQRSLAIETPISVDKAIMETNFLGTIAFTKALLPTMVGYKRGHIVTISSLTGKFGTPLRSSYAASKHALHGFFDSLRAELKPYNIAVTIICPGFVKTNVSINAYTATGAKQGTMDEATDKGLTPSYVAKKILQAINNQKEEVNIGKREVLGIYLKRFFPTLFSKLITKLKSI